MSGLWPEGHGCGWDGMGLDWTGRGDSGRIRFARASTKTPNKNDTRENQGKDRAGKTKMLIGGQQGWGEGQRGKIEDDSCNPALRELWMSRVSKSRDDLHLGEGGVHAAYYKIRSSICSGLFSLFFLSF